VAYSLLVLSAMQTECVQEVESYKIWAVDNMVYGPIELQTLVEWVQEGRVTPQTWVHTASRNCWVRAKDFPSLREHFPDVTDTAYVPRHGAVTPEELRKFAVFARLSLPELQQFLRFSRLHEFAAGDYIVEKGAPCDAAYFLVSGEVRARLIVGHDEIPLARICEGEFFGEIGMFMQATRTADVVAESETRLLRLTAQAFQLMISEIPQLAAPLLYAMAQSMAHRIADDNQKLKREVTSAFLWR
jgi:hypothetical protein